jgi:diguanylate cyclase (GGDEF)-like protein
MSATAAQQQRPSEQDRYRGAQFDLVVRGSGFLSIVGGAASLMLMAFYPPTPQIGSAGWAAVPLGLLSIGVGLSRITLRKRPSMGAIRASAFLGIAQIAVLQWLAGGGKAPYIELLMLPMLGSAAGQSPRRCVVVALTATAAAFSPLIYGSIDVLATATQFTLLSVMTIMEALVLSSTREHRARLEDAGEHANVLAHNDALTGMPNRRAFDQAIAVALDDAERGGVPMSLLLCDVDSFKQINDTFGHSAGDQVLREIAHTLTGAMRRPDAAYRWAGDEFAVLLRDSDEANARRVAGRLRKAVTKNCGRPDGGKVTLGTGVAALEPGMSVAEVLIEADRTLLSQKARRAQIRGVA